MVIIKFIKASNASVNGPDIGAPIPYLLSNTKQIPGQKSYKIRPNTTLLNFFYIQSRSNPTIIYFRKFTIPILSYQKSKYTNPLKNMGRNTKVQFFTTSQFAIIARILLLVLQKERTFKVYEGATIIK